MIYGLVCGILFRFSFLDVKVIDKENRHPEECLLDGYLFQTKTADLFLL